MNIRCKQGDIAMITKEDPGCDANLGKLVRVCSQRGVDRMGLVIWRIEPLTTTDYYLYWQKSNAARLKTSSDVVDHPDLWMEPIRPDECVEDLEFQLELVE